MDTFGYRKYTQEKVLQELKRANLRNPEWHKPITQLDHSIVIWYLKELVEKQEFVDEIFALAKVYAESKDPTPEQDELNERVEKGEDINNIYTVRGTVCWLLVAIAATFRTDLYPEIISLVEKLAFDRVYYVRKQATVPISFFARNIRARQHADGTLFNFRDEDRLRVVELSFQMLRKHRDLPRVLESVVHIFDAMRSLNESQAQEVVEHLFYNSKKEIQPEYITHESVPLLIFFAEFRSTIGDGFSGKWFQDFAIKVLKLSEKQAPRLRSTFMWHTWKVIESDPKAYEKFKKYIPFFFRDEFENEPLGQYDFLVKEVLKASPDDGVALYKTLLNYVLKWSAEYSIQQHAWLLTSHEIVQEIAKVSPKDLLEVLHKITEIVSRRIYVGYLKEIYESYLLVTDKKEGEAMRPEIQKLLEIARKSTWAEKLPETI